MPKNKLEILGGLLALMLVLAGCKPADETQSATSSASSATFSPSKEIVSIVLPTRPDMGGGAYNSEQQTLIESGTFKDSEQALTAWFEYWANALNSPFHPETTDLHYKYVFDSTDKSSGVCLESSAYRGICFSLPIINGEVATVPPTVNGSYEIPVGYGPLQLSDQLSAEQVSALKLDESLTDSVLGYQDGNWVRIKNGQVVETLDLESAQWVAKGEAKPTEEATTEPIEDIDSLFTEKGMVRSEHLSMRVSDKSLENIGIPNGFTVDSAKLEDAYKLLLSRWAWALAKGSDDPRLTIFKNVDQTSMEAMLKAYNDNAALGSNGFDYVFDFGYPFGGGVNRIEGKVDHIGISMTNDSKEWNEIVDNLKSNKIGFILLYAPTSSGRGIFYFNGNGNLEVIFNGQDSLYPTPGLTSANLMYTFALPMVMGEGGIKQAAKVPGSWTDPVSIGLLFGCDGPDYCSTPGSTSDFKY